MPSGARPPIPPLFAKMVVSGTNMTHQVKTVSYLALAGTSIATSDLNTLSTTINTAFNTRFLSQLGDIYLTTGVQLLYIPSVGNEIVGSSAASHQGARVGGNVADASACYLINWNVNKYYKGGHPRWYLPGVITADVTNGSTVGGTQRTNLATAANGFLNDCNAATTTNITSVQLGTLSFQHNKAWRVPPIFFPFVSGAAGAFIATQRRRIHS